MNDPHQPFVLGEWRIDPSTGELRRGDKSIRLEPRVMEVLVHLVGAGGRVVSKQELFDEVWNGAAVSDDVLRRCIYNLRSALGDDSARPRYIRTLPRRGYQIVADVSAAAPAERGEATLRGPGAAQDTIDKPPATSTTALPSPSSTRRPLWATPAALPGRVLLVATVLLLLIVAVVLLATTTGSTLQAEWAPLLLADGTPAPATAPEYFDLAERLAAQRGSDDLERAIELFNKGLELEPENAAAHAGLANVYALSVRGYFRDVSRLDLATEHATLALQLEPGLAEANKALGIAFAGKGWLSSAAREYERALEKRPGYSAVINNLAITEMSRGRPDRAVELLERLDGATPNRSVYLSNLGYAYRMLGDYATARRMLEASLDVMPANANAAANLAVVDLVEGNLAAARERMSSSLSLYPDDAPLHATAGLVELAAGDARRAEQLFRKSAAMSAEGTNNRAWLGIAYLHLQRDEQRPARQIFADFHAFAEESRRLRREFWAPHYNLAAIYSMSGRLDDAAVELEQAIARGYVDVGMLEVDPFLDRLREHPGYRAIVSDLRGRLAKMREEAHGARTR